MNTHGIWKYSDLLQPFVQEKYRLSIKEGSTQLEENSKIAKELKLENIFLKREDLNPTGSHKDRGLAYQISAHIQDKKETFSLSSSGNAAISAINLLKGTKHPLYVFLSTKTSKIKLERLTKNLDEKTSKEILSFKNTSFQNLSFYFSQKPLSEEIRFSKENNTTSLRGSTDKYGSEGFKTIAYEIKENIDSIFIPTSSGNTAKGIYEGLNEMNINIPIHIVQTTKVNTLARKYDDDFEPSKTSKAKSIVDRIGHKSREIDEIIQKTQGFGWVVDNNQISQSQNLLIDNKIFTSNESALTISGIKKAIDNNWKILRPLCIFTGTT